MNEEFLHNHPLLFTAHALLLLGFVQSFFPKFRNANFLQSLLDAIEKKKLDKESREEALRKAFPAYQNQNNAIGMLSALFGSIGYDGMFSDRVTSSDRSRYWNACNVILSITAVCISTMVSIFASNAEHLGIDATLAARYLVKIGSLANWIFFGQLLSVFLSLFTEFTGKESRAFHSLLLFAMALIFFIFCYILSANMELQEFSFSQPIHEDKPQERQVEKPLSRAQKKNRSRSRSRRNNDATKTAPSAF